MKRFLLLGVALTLLSTYLFASNGAKPIATNGIDAGRGGAGVAVGDSAHSIALNPAAITNIDSWFRLDTSLSLRFSRTRFSNKNNPERFASDFGSLVPSLSFAYTPNWGSFKVPITSTSKSKLKEQLPCENCGRLVDVRAPKCMYCGAEFEIDGVASPPTPEEKLPCENCKRPVGIKEPKCPYCGVKFEVEEENTPSQDLSFWQRPPVLKKNPRKWKIGLSIFGALGAGGKSLLSSEVFSAVESHTGLAVITIAPTLAYRFSRYFSIGASLHYYSISLADSDGIIGGGGTSGGLVYDYSTNPRTPVCEPVPCPAGTQLTYDRLFSVAGTNNAVATSFIDIDDASGFGIGGSVGLFFNPSPYFSFGLSYTFESKASDIKGVAALDASKSIEKINNDPNLKATVGSLFQALLPNGFSKGLVSNFDFALSNFIIPAVLNAGVAIHPFDRLMFAMDFRWIRWSTAFNQFNVTLTNGDNADIAAVVGGTTVHSSLKYFWSDQFVFAIGMEYVATRSKNGSELIFQIGYNHTNNPAPPETTGPLTAPGISRHLTFGMIVDMKSSGFSITYVRGLTKVVKLEKNISLPEYSNTYQESNQDTFFFSFWINF